MSRADFFFAMLSRNGIGGVEGITARVMELSPKARENGAPHTRCSTKSGNLTTVFGTRDNGDMYIARAFAQQAQFFGAVSRLSLPQQVVSLTPTLGTDWNGNEAVFFQVVLLDNAVPRNQLLAFTKQISHSIITQLNPNEEWGVWPYFDFITQSELARVKQPTWA